MMESTVSPTADRKRAAPGTGSYFFSVSSFAICSKASSSSALGCFTDTNVIPKSKTTALISSPLSNDEVTRVEVAARRGHPGHRGVCGDGVVAAMERHRREGLSRPGEPVVAVAWLEPAHR